MKNNKNNNKLLSKPIIWHEFGHIFSYVLINKLYNDQRKITCINLTKTKSKNPYIETNYRELSNDLNKRLLLLKNNKVLLKEILILIMGAVFHITIFKKNDIITLRDFKEIFINIQYENKDEYLIGHAGSDFRKIERLISDSNSELSFNDIKEFAFKLQKLLHKHKIYENLKSMVDEFNTEYNGETIHGVDLYKKERLLISELISESCIRDINELIKENLTK